MTRVQRKFLQKIRAGLAVFSAVIAFTAGVIFLYRFFGFDAEAASSLGLLTVMVVSIGGFFLESAWRQSKREVEEETRKVEEALRGQQ